jgi:aminoglycoside phosphotransferase (APT) family kinase protein
MDIYSSSRMHERILIQNLERIVLDSFGSRSAIQAVQRERFPFIGSYDCDLVTVRLSTGEEFRLFLKDYRNSQKSKDGPQLRRERELRVYRDLLSQAEFGTPKYYGSVWDPSEEMFWILLEFVDGVIVKDHDVEYGILAAQWLARMQSFFVQHQEMLGSCDFLIRQDAEFFRSKAQLSLINVGQISPSAAHLLAQILRAYEPVIELLKTAPFTLVHGGFIPWHILLDFKQQPTRVCAIDWELAAIGPTLYDLAYFTDGMEPEPRDRILDAYRQAAIQYGVPLSTKTQMLYILNCLRLHRIFDWLSRSLEKQFTATKVVRLVDQAQQLGRILQL